MLVVSFGFRVGRPLPPPGSRILDRGNTVRAGGCHLGPDIRQDCAEIADHRANAVRRQNELIAARTRIRCAERGGPFPQREALVVARGQSSRCENHVDEKLSVAIRDLSSNAICGESSTCEKQPRCRLLGRNATCTGLRERIDTMLVFETRLGRQASDGIARSFEEGAEKLGCLRWWQVRLPN